MVSRIKTVADRMEHPPGEEGQIDFFKSKARVRDPRTPSWRYTWVFRMTLSCSKHGYEEAPPDQKATSFLRAQEHAFIELACLGWCAWTTPRLRSPGPASTTRPQRAHEALAQHWGFIPLPSRPHHPQDQGVQERSGGYVSDSALKGRSFESVAEMNEFLRRWTAGSPSNASTAAPGGKS
jgi:transposase